MVVISTDLFLPNLTLSKNLTLKLLSQRILRWKTEAYLDLENNPEVKRQLEIISYSSLVQLTNAVNNSNAKKCNAQLE